eukprot:COSAG03_NODE_9559_length_711_cov_0.717320_1_plen_68_part_10
MDGGRDAAPLAVTLGGAAGADRAGALRLDQLARRCFPAADRLRQRGERGSEEARERERERERERAAHS